MDWTNIAADSPLTSIIQGQYKCHQPVVQIARKLLNKQTDNLAFSLVSVRVHDLVDFLLFWYLLRHFGLRWSQTITTLSISLPNSSTLENCYRHPRVSNFLISDWSIYGLLIVRSSVQLVWSNQIVSIIPVIFIFHPGVPTLIVYLAFSLLTSDSIVSWLNMFWSNEIICIILVVSIFKTIFF